MKYSDIMIRFGYNATRAAAFIGVTVFTMMRWKKINSIPFDKQCMIQVMTDGELKASMDDDITWDKNWDKSRYL